VNLISPINFSKVFVVVMALIANVAAAMMFWSFGPECACRSVPVGFLPTSFIGRAGFIKAAARRFLSPHCNKKNRSNKIEADAASRGRRQEMRQEFNEVAFAFLQCRKKYDR
jgi:hypothetical protein